LAHVNTSYKNTYIYQTGFYSNLQPAKLADESVLLIDSIKDGGLGLPQFMTHLPPVSISAINMDEKSRANTQKTLFCSKKSWLTADLSPGVSLGFSRTKYFPQYHNKRCAGSGRQRSKFRKYFGSFDRSLWWKIWQKRGEYSDITLKCRSNHCAGIQRKTEKNIHGYQAF
jgi:hypothetical protein